MKEVSARCWCCLKAEHSYENFHNPKGQEGKKATTINVYEIFLVFPFQTQNTTYQITPNMFIHVQFYAKHNTLVSSRAFLTS